MEHEREGQELSEDAWVDSVKDSANLGRQLSVPHQSHSQPGEKLMEFNVGGLKWFVVGLIACLIGLPFLKLSGPAYWGALVAVPCGAYAIGSHLLLRRLRSELRANQPKEP